VTGHSLGGALAQLVGAVTGAETTTFNAPGVKDVLYNNPSTFGNFSDTANFDNINNYNYFLDPVHLVGDQIGDNTTIGGDFTQTVQDVVNAYLTNPGPNPIIVADFFTEQHSIDKMIDTLGRQSDDSAIDPGQPEDPYYGEGGDTTPGDSGSSEDDYENIPDPTGTSTTTSYTVQDGDTLSDIAFNNGISIQDLLDANPDIADPDLIYPADEIVIPESDPVVTGGGAGTLVSENGPVLGETTLHNIQNLELTFLNTAHTTSPHQGAAGNEHRQSMAGFKSAVGF
jgi:LysM repeat protein